MLLSKTRLGMLDVFICWLCHPLLSKSQYVLFKLLSMSETEEMNTALHHNQFCLGGISKHFNFLFGIGDTEDNIVCSLVLVRYQNKWEQSTD